MSANDFQQLKYYLHIAQRDEHALRSKSRSFLSDQHKSHFTIEEEKFLQCRPLVYHDVLSDYKRFFVLIILTPFLGMYIYNAKNPKNTISFAELFGVMFSHIKRAIVKICVLLRRIVRSYDE